MSVHIVRLQSFLIAIGRIFFTSYVHRAARMMHQSEHQFDSPTYANTEIMWTYIARSISLEEWGGESGADVCLYICVCVTEVCTIILQHSR